MCGGSKKSAAPAPVAPTYQYFPEASRNPQQQIASETPSTTASFGSELSSAPAAAPAATSGGM